MTARRSGSRTLARLLLLPIALLLFGASLAHAQVYLDLHDFAVGAGTPQFPWLMAQGRDGNLYGVTGTGGTHSKGSLFQITPSGHFTLLHSFDGSHGMTPVGGLTLGLDGDLYGMAERGGKNGQGNIFKITTAGDFTVLYNFKAGKDGGLPVSPLIVGADGNFYGTSYPGAAFRMTPAGVVTVLTSLPTTSYGPLLEAKDGSFYAVSEFGGTKSAGAIFRIAGNKATTVHSFDGPSGSFPTGGLVEGSDGNFYGTTTAGGGLNGGVIYRLTSSGHYHVMFNWDDKQTANGYQAFAGLIAGADGNFYGVTIWGGDEGNGVIYAMTTGGGYSVLQSFHGPQGVGAYATPVQHTNGELFGITNRGGGAGDGVIYSFDDNLAPFIRLLTNAGFVGGSVGILGHGFSQATNVTFNGTPASFRVLSNTYMTTTIPSGETGFVRVSLSGGNDLESSRVFRVTPQLTGFSPQQGQAGDSVTITGGGLIQTVKITVGGVAVSAFTVSSDSKLTIHVPTGAKTGKIVVTTPGGSAKGQGTFTVTP